MAAPSYTTDLSAQVISPCDSNSTPLTFTNIGTGSDATETDYYIQGSACISKPFNITAGGIYVTTSQAITSGQCFWAWYYFACPNALLAETAGGLQAMLGQSATNYDKWNVRGNDTYTYGGWVCVPIDPINVTQDNRAGSGKGSSPFLVFGVYANTSVGISKGNPLGIDIMRYGRGEARINGGETSNYATFSGFATQNDNNSNRWGLIQAIDGGYLQQGLVILGYTSAVDFRDSNKSILIANTKKVQSSFNRWEVRQASSRVDWTNISILALGIVAKGEFECIDNADVNISFCVFTDMSSFKFLSGSTILNSTFRRTGQITIAGATITGCVIDNNTATSAILAASPSEAALVSNTNFISDGTGYAIEITGTAANITLTNNTYTGYASSDGTSGNEAIFINIAAGSMNLTISGGGTPSIRTAGATVTVISGAVSATVVVKDTSAPPVAIEAARVLVLADTGGPFPYNVTVTITNSGTTATVSHTAHAMANNDVIQITGASLAANNGIFTITKINNDSYSYTMLSTPGSNPTGTIKANFVVLSGVTDSNGSITMSRVFSSNQPIFGWARKSTSSPLYQQGFIVGTVNSSSGFSTTIQLIKDE